MSANPASANPTELRVTPDRKTLVTSFDNGNQYELAAEMLRVMSPSAEVQGHGSEQRKLLGGKRNVAITGVEPVGNYAVRITFDDLHSTGIFTWVYLHELGENREERWNTYLEELAAHGLDRDRPGEVMPNAGKPAGTSK